MVQEYLSVALEGSQHNCYAPKSLHCGLQLWAWREGRVAMSLFQKAFSRDTWPLIQLPPDERLAFHMVTGTVNAFDPASFASGELAGIHVCLPHATGGHCFVACTFYAS